MLLQLHTMRASVATPALVSTLTSLLTKTLRQTSGQLTLFSMFFVTLPHKKYRVSVSVCLGLPKSKPVSFSTLSLPPLIFFYIIMYTYRFFVVWL